MITRWLRQLGNTGRWLAALAAIGLLLVGWPFRRALGSTRQDQGESSSRRETGPLPKDTTVKRTPEQAAQEDIEVGGFYAHKGDLDAAIGRYQDAVAAAPKLAKAHLLLAEAFEKKGDKTTAVKYYKEYLEVDPNAPDKQKIQKKIEKLSR
jgi:Tfp pilus assembly protein PilF